MEKCEIFCYFFPYAKRTIWSYSVAKNKSGDRTVFFFNSERKKETINHKEAIRMKQCITLESKKRDLRNHAQITHQPV